MDGQKEANRGYTFLWGDHNAFWMIEANINTIFKFSHINPWCEISNIIEVLRNNRCSTYHSNKDIKNDYEKGKLFLEKEYPKTFINDLEKTFKEHWDFFNKIGETDFSKLSDEELIGYFNTALDNCSKILCFFKPTQEEGTYYLTEELKKYFSEKEVCSLMISPDLDIVNKEQLDWQKIVESDYSEEKMMEHSFRYPWIVLGHYTKEDVLDTLSNRYGTDKNNPYFIDIIEEKNNIKDEQEKIIEKVPEAIPLVRLAQRLSLSRNEVKSCWAGTDFYLIPVVEEISKRTGEHARDICIYYLIDEVSMLFEGRILSEKEKQDRKRCSVGLWKDGEKKFFFGDEAESVAKKELGDLYETKSVDEFKGMTAYPGKFKGVVRILLANDVENTNKLRKTFEKGQILVTGMTQPNIVDIASRAAAMVTDQGGMLSHAAIISREFKTPCIVGTKIATKVLKDGDKIEVDADRGIVRKIT